MTDADDAGLVKALKLRGSGLSLNAADRIEVQQQQIEGLKGIVKFLESAIKVWEYRTDKAEAELAEAVDILDGIDLDVVGVPWRTIEAFFAKYPRWTHGGGMAKVETTLTLEQLDAALKLNGKLCAFDAGYAKGFAAGLEAAARYVENQAKLHTERLEDTGEEQYLSGRTNWIAGHLAGVAKALRERAEWENKRSKTIEREGK